MFEQFFDSPLRVQALRNGPSGALLEGLAQELGEAGYAEITARRHIRAAEHFIYWANKEGIRSAATNGNAVLGSKRFEEQIAKMLKCRVTRGKAGRPTRGTETE